MIWCCTLEVKYQFFVCTELNISAKFIVFVWKVKKCFTLHAYGHGLYGCLLKDTGSLLVSWNIYPPLWIVEMKKMAQTLCIYEFFYCFCSKDLFWITDYSSSEGKIFTWGWGGSHGTFSEDGLSSGGQLVCF